MRVQAGIERIHFFAHIVKMGERDKIEVVLRRWSPMRRSEKNNPHSIMQPKTTIK
jgi:ribosome biogenesis protein Nip4